MNNSDMTEEEWMREFRQALSLRIKPPLLDEAMAGQTFEGLSWGRTRTPVDAVEDFIRVQNAGSYRDLSKMLLAAPVLVLIIGIVLGYAKALNWFSGAILAALFVAMAMWGIRCRRIAAQLRATGPTD